MKSVLNIKLVGPSVLFFFAIAFFAGQGFTAWAADANVPGGSYKTTCKNIRFDKAADTIRASCRKMDGTWNHSAGLGLYSSCF